MPFFEPCTRRVRAAIPRSSHRWSCGIFAFVSLNVLSACLGPAEPVASATRSLPLQVPPLDARVDAAFRSSLVEGQVITISSKDYGEAEFITFGCFGGLCFGPLQADPDYQLHAASWAPLEAGKGKGITAVFTSPRNLVFSLSPNGSGSVSDGFGPATALRWSVAG